jgi:predicted small lipoprotein YifL
MTKHITVVLAFAILFSLCACGNGPITDVEQPSTTTQSTPAASNFVAATDEPTAALSIDDPEILRAISYGFVPSELQRDWNTTITFKQFSIMLKNMLSVYDNKLVPQWEVTASKALISNDLMHRDQGILATYYAATLMGIGQTTNGNWHMDQIYGIDVQNGFYNDYGKWFPDCHQESPFYDIEWTKRISGWDYVASSIFWCMGQTSPVSGKTIFDIDFDKKTLRPMDSLSRKEAIWAVLRLYESTLKPTDNLLANDAKSTEILTLADTRRNAIINSETTITSSDTFIQGQTFTGTAYYVSNSGDDALDGKSAETAWATMEKVNTAQLKYGDAVFFKRGDIWYEQLWGQSGVTYSAYGTGAKPVISGSVAENAADPEKWKLSYAGDHGEKIWVYYRDLLDVTGIFFDQGHSWANKVYPYWDDKNKQYVFKTGEIFNANTGLANDLDFFANIDLTKTHPLDNVNESGATGPLYLRSDAGNPGELYSNIEFEQAGTGISPVGNNGKDMTVDNIKIVYFGNVGVAVAGYQGWINTIVQNSEFGWCGGGITNYANDSDFSDKYAIAKISGCAIQLSGPQNTAINNYIHHCASKSIVLAIHERHSLFDIYSDDVIKGNLLEYSASSLHVANYMANENPSAPSGFKNITFEDNYVLFSGYGWVDTNMQRTDSNLEKLPASAVDFGGEYENKNEGIFIKNNILYMAKYALIDCFMPKDNQPIFSGNTYAQSENGWLAKFRGRLFSITENGEEYVQNELLDDSGTVLIVK